MKLNSTIFQQSLLVKGKKSFLRKVSIVLFKLIRSGVLKIWDPPCELTIHGKKMAIPLSHQLASCTASFPKYDSHLRRISDFLRTRDGYLHQIDVGANIGDTILACFNNTRDIFLAIEPNSLFHSYLQINLGKFQDNVIFEKFLCTSADGQTAVEVNQAAGTAIFKPAMDSEGESLESLTLDSAVKRHPVFSDCNFVKIDTDGYDFEVIKGAKKIIDSVSPFVLFECHIFGNKDYYKEVKSILSLFAKSGYTQALVYDNIGNLFTVLNLEDRDTFDQALLYQLIGDRLYFDILVMKNGKDFVKKEHAYFLETITDPAWKLAARDAINSIHSKPTDESKKQT